MRFLVTAGNTQTPIDRTRCITNIFTGRTGLRIASEAARRGHDVCLLTSHPELDFPPTAIDLRPYRTYDDLHDLMARLIPVGSFDGVIHSAAVSDYQLSAAYAPDETPAQAPDRTAPEVLTPPSLRRVSAGKVKSTFPELWLRLVPTRKLIDLVRTDWGFAGVLVKFKLEVGLGDDELLRVAEASRRHSRADVMVANTLDGMTRDAFLGPVLGPPGPAGERAYERVDRPSLASRLIDVVEARVERPLSETERTP